MSDADTTTIPPNSYVDAEHVEDVAYVLLYLSRTPCVKAPHFPKYLMERIERINDDLEFIFFHLNNVPSVRDKMNNHVLKRLYRATDHLREKPKPIFSKQ